MRWLVIFLLLLFYCNIHHLFVYFFSTMWSLTSVELSLSITARRIRRKNEGRSNEIIHSHSHALDNCSTFNQNRINRQTDRRTRTHAKPKIHCSNRLGVVLFLLIVFISFSFCENFFYVSNASMQLQHFNFHSTQISEISTTVSDLNRLTSSTSKWKKRKLIRYRAHTCKQINYKLPLFYSLFIISFEWIPKSKTFHAFFFRFTSSKKQNYRHTHITFCIRANSRPKKTFEILQKACKRNKLE